MVTAGSGVSGGPGPVSMLLSARGWGWTKPGTAPPTLRSLHPSHTEERLQEPKGDKIRTPGFGLDSGNEDSFHHGAYQSELSEVSSGPIMGNVSL